jgi:hypothetical protein
MSRKLSKRQLTALLCGLFLALEHLGAAESGVNQFSASLKIVAVNGVELHYLQSGSGVPVVLIHGGLGDYREWSAQIEPPGSNMKAVFKTLKLSRQSQLNQKSDISFPLVEKSEVKGQKVEDLAFAQLDEIAIDLKK